MTAPPGRLTINRQAEGWTKRPRFSQNLFAFSIPVVYPTCYL